MSIKLVYCIASLSNPGGMERVLSTKANYLAENLDYEVHIAEKCNIGTPFFPLSTKIICHNLNSNTNNEYRKKLTQLLYKIHPDITISMYGSEYKFLYKIKDGSKKVLECHFTRHYLTHLVNGIQKLKFRFLHKIKAIITEYDEGRYCTKYDKIVLLTKKDLGIWGNKTNMCYIYNPLSFHSTSKSDLTQKQIIATGRYIAQKGFDLLIDSFALIAEKHKDWKLIIFGEGQDELLLQEKISQYNLNGQVVLHSPVKNIQEEYLKSSIFVFPSRYEGFGLVLTEAMECGLPCIAFDCECGPSEIIIDNVTGYLVKSNDVNEFANKIDILINKPDLRTEMGVAGKKAVSKFYETTIMQQWNKLFCQLVNMK